MVVSTKAWVVRVDEVTYQGVWTQEESELLIYCLEMRAVILAFSHFHKAQHYNVQVVSLERDRIVVHCYGSNQHFNSCQVHSWQNECYCQ